MLVNVFLILVSYYVIKTVREPLILGTEVPGFLQALGIKSAAEVKTFAAAGQALVLMAFVPAYSWFASRVEPDEAHRRGHPLLRGEHPRLRGRGARRGALRRRGVLRVGGLLQPLDHRAVLVVRERHLHEGRRQPPLPHHRDRRDGGQPGRGLGRRASLRRPRERPPDALPGGGTAAAHPRPLRRREPRRLGPDRHGGGSRPRRRRSGTGTPSRSSSAIATSCSSRCCSSS